MGTERTVSKTVTEHRLSDAWYVQMRGSFYSFGPFRYGEMVSAERVVADAVNVFGELPREVYPDGIEEEVEEYEYEVQPDEDEDAET